jgi:hypothetical protein
MAKPTVAKQDEKKVEKIDSSWVPWSDRKVSNKPYRCRSAHLTRTGDAKLEALYVIKMAERDSGGFDDTAKPEKSRILERGLNLQLLEYGINPLDAVSKPDVVIKRAVDKIKAKAEGA